MKLAATEISYRFIKQIPKPIAELEFISTVFLLITLYEFHLIKDRDIRLIIIGAFQIILVLVV